MKIPVKQKVTAGLILVWLTLQIVIPFARKFDLPHFQYRYATFSWAMYSKPGLYYDVSLYCEGPEGIRKGIPDIKKYVREYASPEPLSMHDYYRTKDQIQDWHARLVKAIAKNKKDGALYGVSIRWQTVPGLVDSSLWEYQARAEGA